MSSATMFQQETLLSGSVGHHVNSARAGFLPVPLERTPPSALSGLDIYLKVAGVI